MYEIPEPPVALTVAEPLLALQLAGVEVIPVIVNEPVDPTIIVSTVWFGGTKLSVTLTIYVPAGRLLKV